MSHRAFEKAQNTWESFHDDERGESSALSNIMLIAIAALILVAVLTFATDFWTRVKAIIDGLLGNNQGQNGDG